MTHHTDPGTIVVGVDGSSGGRRPSTGPSTRPAAGTCRSTSCTRRTSTTSSPPRCSTPTMPPTRSTTSWKPPGSVSAPRRRSCRSGPRPRRGPPPTTWWSAPPEPSRSWWAHTARARSAERWARSPPGRHAREVPGGRARPGTRRLDRAGGRGHRRIGAVQGGRGVRHRAGLPARRSARRRLHLVDRVHRGSRRDHAGLAPVAEVRERQRLTVGETMAGWQEKYPDVEVEVHIEHGRPADALVAASERASLLVVGARGRGGFGGLLLGSVSHAVLHRALPGRGGPPSLNRTVRASTPVVTRRVGRPVLAIRGAG